MKEKRSKRISMTFNEKEYDLVLNKAFDDKQFNLSGFAKRKLLKALEVSKCQTV
ncbi:MAG: hypothetical protein KC646_10365 [Candidatus Cloacimonetes bacterium]|nr:hypothetical protein [Candidatus Cloacimonadota bacterium]